MIGLAVLFLIPIYYLAKSKGYNALPVCVISGGIGILGPMVLAVITGEVYPFADCTVALGALIVVWLLPARKGAPGKAYLKITFTCPECKTSVTFPRHEEGLAVLCPSCGEIITVPLDEFSPKMPQHIEKHHSAVGGRTCLETYGNEIKAYEIKTLLEGGGIQAMVVGGDGGGMLPQVGISQGYDVMVKTEDMSRAIEMREAANNPSQPLVNPDGSPNG